MSFALNGTRFCWLIPSFGKFKKTKTFILFVSNKFGANKFLLLAYCCEVKKIAGVMYVPLTIKTF